MTIRIAVAGAGLIDRRHIEEVDVSRSAQLVSIVEPGPVGPELARKYDAARYASLDEMIAADRPDGVIPATPNQMHVAGGVSRPPVGCSAPRVGGKPIRTAGAQGAEERKRRGSTLAVQYEAHARLAAHALNERGRVVHYA